MFQACEMTIRSSCGSASRFYADFKKFATQTLTIAPNVMSLRRFFLGAAVKQGEALAQRKDSLLN
jgi:hypothetical protein